ncbi:tripartite tricarboxylate transporter substrate binding protein [Lampropedia puyangensis]|uniref:Tripartite tricarboxylate transporter substrate binding protein n=1 Tax=Lampropedia puyangensis TaxID=1330072 RepID=A0A4S8EQA0_9BURK|nr:tripartite tricarboxylate transporter substrate-binding protein [Lampropedia puyangensis]THT96476.1 tripartite tricarboxylate transporter substrate binding protein [Lampropedia puyangensis]
MAVALLLVGGAAQAQTNAWPNKPIRLIVPYAPGGFTDQMARLVAPGLQVRLGQPVVVENKPGGNSLIGVADMARSAPDGYTFGVVIAAYAANTTLYAKLPYDPKQVRGVSLMGISPLLAGVAKSSPYQNINDVIKDAKAHPGKISFGSSGNGSSVHLTTELLAWRTKVEMVHVPYRGAAPALADLLGGHIQLFLDAPVNLIEQSGPQGRVRLVGVAGDERLPAVPDVPTFAEQGVDGVTGSTWAALIAPAGVPDEIVQKVSKATAEIIREEKTVETLHRMGTFAKGLTPEETDAFIKTETDKWAAVIHQADIRLD